MFVLGSELTIIVGMAAVTVGSSIAQIILKSLGKVDESQMMDFVTKCLLVVTACTTFAGAVKAIISLI